MRYIAISFSGFSRLVLNDIICKNKIYLPYILQFRCISKIFIQYRISILSNLCREIQKLMFVVSFVYLNVWIQSSQFSSDKQYTLNVHVVLAK